jgi:AcrR family transcriptional regulator
MMRKTKPTAARPGRARSDRPAQERIFGAAFAAFQERGYADTSTLEIATRAKVSKRELYTLFDNKRALLTACIAERAKQMRLPLELPAASDRKTVAATLAAFGAALLRGVCDPSVLAVYRLAIAESERSPEIARVLDRAGRAANQAALTEFLAKAKERGLIDGDPAKMTSYFVGLLWRDLLVRLLLQVTDPPTIEDVDHRAREAAEMLLMLYPCVTPAAE